MKKLKKMTQEESIRLRNYLAENRYTEKYIAEQLEISTATMSYACRCPEKVSHATAALIMRMVDGGQLTEKAQAEKLPESKRGTLYHVTRIRELETYKSEGVIHSPEGYTTFKAAIAHAMEFGGEVIIKVSGFPVYKCRKLHNKYGERWWIDQDVTDWSVEVSTGDD